MLDNHDTNNRETVKEVTKERCFLITGVPVKRSKVIGLCNNALHWGWLDIKTYEQHRCKDKECAYFQKANPDYWNRKTAAKRKSAKLRAMARKEKEERERRDADIRAILESNQHIHVTSIKETHKRLEISYIFDERVDLNEEIKILRERYKFSVYLKAIQTSLENKKALIGRGKSDL